jgi:ABC-type transport system substrate-binding protein
LKIKNRYTSFHMRRFSFINLPAALLGVLLIWSMLSGCARGPRTPGVLRLTTGTDPSTLDPARAYDTTSLSTTRVLYRGLVDYGDGANIVPVVARSYKISPDGNTYTFYLRDDVRFHFDNNGNSPGRRVVAEDFRYALERVLDPATTSEGLSPFQIIDGAKEFGEAKKKNPDAKIHVRGIRVKGNDEISFTLKQPDITFLNWLTLPFASAVPREWIEKLKQNDEEFSENPNGCGPFLMKRGNWVHDNFLKLEKNPDYFDKTLPKANGVELQIGGGDMLQMMRFELGDTDVYSLEETAAPDYLRITRSEKWKNQVIHAPMMDVRYLCMNTELPPFNDVRVRQAVNLAINKSRIVATQAGRVEAARGVLPPGMPGYNRNLKGYDYDPDQARKLLKEAGFVNDPKNPIVLWYANMVWYPKGAQSIQADLKKVGMDIGLKSVTYPELKTAGGQRKNLKLSIMGWLQDYPDPSNFLDVLFHSKGIRETSSLNRAFYSNPKVDALLNDAATEQNRQKRLQMYQRIEQMVMNDAPWVPLVHTERYVVTQPWIKDYQLHPMWSARYEYVSVTK